MQVRVLMAAHDASCADLLRSLLDESLRLVPLDIAVECVGTRDDLMRRLTLHTDDVVLLDWDLAREATPDLVGEMLCANPAIRVVALLPMQLRQYRRRMWEAGASSSVPKEHMDQEWLSGVLCLLHSDLCREAAVV